MKTNQLQIEIDGIDKEILRDLMDDARKPILQIAHKIGISGAAIHQRLKKLDADGELQETSHWLATALACAYITKNQFTELQTHIGCIGKMIGKMMSKPESFTPKQSGQSLTSDL